MRRAFKFNSKGMTLIELSLAVLLLNVIILTAVSMELGLRRLFTSTDIEVRLLDEATPILTLVTKDINRGIGHNVSGSDLSPYGMSCIGGIGSDPLFCIRIDSNNNATADAGDRWAAYRYRNTGTNRYQLWYYRDASSSSYEILSRRVMNFNVTAPVNGSSNITLQLRMDPASTASFTNPEITINTSAQYREYPLR